MAAQNNLDTTSSKAQELDQAIYACLASIFNEEEVNLALKSWAHHTNGVNSEFNGVNTFAREICNTLNKPEKHRELAKALNRALIVKYSTPIKHSNQDLPKNSENSLSKPKVAIMPSPTEQAAGPYSFLTFQLVLLALMKHISLRDEATKDKAITFLNEITETMPWSEIQQEQIHALINDGGLQPTRTYKLDQLKNFLKYLKSWMTDELGLDTANIIINQSVKEVSTMKEAKDFSPNNLF